MVHQQVCMSPAAELNDERKRTGSACSVPVLESGSHRACLGVNTHLQAFPGQPAVLHVFSGGGPVDLVGHTETNVSSGNVSAELLISGSVGLAHRLGGQVQAVGPQQVDVVFPSDQQPALILIQQQDLVAAADSALPEDR